MELGMEKFGIKWGSCILYPTLGIQAKAVGHVLVDLQALILQGQWISFRHSPTQSFDLQIYRFTDFLNKHVKMVRPISYSKLLQYTLKKN